MKKILLCLITLTGMLVFSGTGAAQTPYYFHTIHSHGLSFAGGRTAKLNYMYQQNHARQIKLSGTYVFDAYTQGANEIEANLYNINLQFQFKTLRIGRLFINTALGGGGYYLKARDLLDIEHDEWQPNFVVGWQAEFYLIRNKVALTADYDILFTPWSDIYRFLHVPTGGITLFFF